MRDLQTNISLSVNVTLAWLCDIGLSLLQPGLVLDIPYLFLPAYCQLQLIVAIHSFTNQV
jgi:hypothetical protein